MSVAPPVSIGLPVYNGERYLPLTLRDLLGQTYGDFELVVCDNASTDATADIIREAAARDARVRYVRNETNIGALPNTNRAFALSRGARYALAAHDDRHAPDFLARLVNALNEDPGAVLAYGDQTLIGEDGQPFAFDPERRVYVGPTGEVYAYDAALQRSLSDDPVARYRAVLHTSDTNAPIHGLFRRDALERIGPHTVYGSERLVLAHGALLGRFSFVNAPLFAYRLHPGSTLHLSRDERIARETGRPARGSVLDALRSLRAYLGAVADADLRLSARTRAVTATLAYAARTDRLRRLLAPGPDNLVGWRRSSDAGVHPKRTEIVGAKGNDWDRWKWLMEGETSNRTGTEEPFGAAPA